MHLMGQGGAERDSRRQTVRPAGGFIKQFIERMTVVSAKVLVVDTGSNQTETISTAEPSSCDRQEKAAQGILRMWLSAHRIILGAGEHV